MREEIRASNLDLHTGLDVDSQIAEATFTYIDWISQQVVATYQDEHDRWLENRNNMRALRVRRSSTVVTSTPMLWALRFSTLSGELISPLFSGEWSLRGAMNS